MAKTKKEHERLSKKNHIIIKNLRWVVVEVEVEEEEKQVWIYIHREKY